MSYSDNVFINPDALYTASKSMSAQHYEPAMKDQTGGGASMPTFQGLSRQKGSGLLGNILYSVARQALPDISRRVKRLATDVGEGTPFGKAVKREAVRFIKGEGRIKLRRRKRRRMKKPATTKTKRARKKPAKKRKVDDDDDWLI